MRYLLIAWPFGIASEPARALCARVAEAGRWRPLADLAGVRVFTAGRPFQAQVLGEAVVIGQVHARRGPAGAAPPRPSAAEDLVAEAWGRYVAILRDADGRPKVLNDPIGGQECLAWRIGETLLVSSEVPVDPEIRPPGLTIDWDVLAAHLPNLSLAPEAAPLGGVVSVGPGCLYDPRTGEQARLWSPAGIARTRGRAETSADGLRDVVERVVASLAKGRRRIVADISGGLDSAIVAAALHRVASFSGVHQRFAEPEADESAHAAEVAARLGASLAIIEREPITWTAQMIEATADGVRPSSNAIDGVFDELLAEHLRAAGADALFTGHGGDAIFYQSPNPGLFLEALRGDAPGLGRARAAANVAFRLRKSYPRLLIEALRAERSEGRGPQSPAWLAEARSLPSARRVQIRALNYARHRFGRSLRERHADLVDPLIAQPVVEWCLRAPVMVLTGGDIDRTLARQAFAADLPARIATRARKGDVSVFFVRSVLNSRSFLRDYLLGGLLREKGLIDPAAVEAALDPEALMWGAVTDLVLPPLAAEAWARVTQARLAAGPRR